MLTIRREQLHAFGEAAAKIFEDHMVVRLGAAYPDSAAALGEDQLRRFIQRQVHRAAGCGIDGCLDLERYLLLAYGILQGLEESEHTPWMNAILEDQTLTPEGKVDRLEGESLLLGIIRES